jgi:putative transposase
MPRGRKVSPEQIVVMLRQIEVQLAQGRSLAQACKEAGISEQSYYRWRKEYGGVAVEQAKRLKELERENARLRRLVADLSLEKQVLKDVAQGNLVQPQATPAGRGWHPREVRPLGAPRLPPRQPAPWHTALRAHRAS